MRHGRQLPQQLTGAALSWAVQKPGVTILRFSGDRVVERHSVGDFDTVVAQLTAD